MLCSFYFYDSWLKYSGVECHAPCLSAPPTSEQMASIQFGWKTSSNPTKSWICKSSTSKFYLKGKSRARNLTWLGGQSCDLSWVELQSGLRHSRLDNDSIHRMLEETQTRPVVSHVKGDSNPEPYACFEVWELITQHCTDLASMLDWKNKHGFFSFFLPWATCALCWWITEQWIIAAD